jgi:hypothetical protein
MADDTPPARIPRDRGDYSSSSLLSPGPIMGGLGLIVAISVAAWFYQQKSVIESQINGLITANAMLNQKLEGELKRADDARKRLGNVFTSKLKGVNDRIERSEQTVAYVENTLGDQIAALEQAIPGAKPQRKTSVRFNKNRDDDRPKPVTRKPASKQPAPLLDIEDDLQEDVDDFNNDDE